MPTPQLDFTDLAMFANGVPHAIFRELRKNTPVYWNPTVDGGFWLLTKHHDIVRVEKDPALFCSHSGITLADPPPTNAGPPWAMIRDGLTHLDAPEHSIHRQLIAPKFTRVAIGAIEDRIRELARTVLDRVKTGSQFNFAEDVALEFPLRVVAGEVLGLPESDFKRVAAWVDAIFAPRDPARARSAAVVAVREIYERGLALFAQRREHPGMDVFSVLANATMVDGKPVDTEVFLRYFWSLLTGAFDTTASAISGGMMALLEHPEQYRQLKENPALIPSAVEEILRWVTPITYFRRTATADTVLRGVTIRRGQRVVMCYASANRDEEVFVQGGDFDIARKPNDHLTFGHGIHFCLGASLAKAEIRILFEEIVQRGLCFERCGPISRVLSNFNNRIRNMPVFVR